MKIAALTPQFIFEPPAAEEDADAQKVARELRHLKLVETNAPEETPKDELDNETRQGLRRLSELIERHQQERKRKDERKEQRANTKDAKRLRIVATYQLMATARLAEEDKGLSFDEFI